MQGKDRLLVKSVAEQLELEGSYVPRTYIEQIQLEKLVNEVMVWPLSRACNAFFLHSCPDLIILQALPDDLKTKLSIDDDLVASPKLALSRASADRVAMRNKNLKRWNCITFVYYSLSISRYHHSCSVFVISRTRNSLSSHAIQTMDSHTSIPQLIFLARFGFIVNIPQQVVQSFQK